MAQTTNFGWQTPDNTDLVKDGALAIRTLGNAIDTSLVDLKGGTTNQILAKNSNTDMDFKWVANDVGDITAVTAGTGLSGGGTSGDVTLTNTVATTFDAKGDLVVGTGADTFAKLVAGSNGDTLVADSSTTTGLRWQAQPVCAGKNIVINGGMDIWQRGTSSSSLGNYHTADRWYQGAWSGTGTWARESTVVPAGSQYSAKFTASATAQPYFIQAMETANAIQLAGKTVTLSALVAASTSTAFTITLSHSSNVDNALTGSWTDITATSGGSATATSTTFVPITGVYSIPSTAKSLRLTIQTASTIANTVVVYIGQVQLEEGSVRTAFSRAGGTLAGELAACQRYYYRMTSAENAFTRFGTFSPAGSTTSCLLVFPHPVTMRVKPTALEFGGTYALSDSNGTASISNMTLFQGSSPNQSILDITCSGATQFRPYIFIANNSTTTYIGVSAEL